MHAIADYGHYAQLALAEERGWAIGQHYAEMDLHYTDSFDYDAVKNAVKGYPLERKLSDEADTFTVALNLLSKTEMRATIRFKDSVSGGVVGASVDSKSVYPESTSGFRGYYADTKPISAHLLNKMHSFVFTYNGHPSTLKTSPLGYVREALEASQSNKLKDDVCALYRYYKATVAFRDAHGY